MNMKNTVILLIFLLSVLGLIIGVYYTDDIGSANAHYESHEKIYEDANGIITITLEKKEQSRDLSKFFT